MGMLVLALFAAAFVAAAAQDGAPNLYVNQPIDFTFAGPSSSQTASPNPFTDFRLRCTFTHSGGTTVDVDGYFACDGNAADSDATSGNKWRCKFAPHLAGKWNWQVSMLGGTDAAYGEGNLGRFTKVKPDGSKGVINVGPMRASLANRDNRRKGVLQYADRHHYRFRTNGEWFLGAGTDSPEGLLNYEDFAGTPDLGGGQRTWSSHVSDWKSGDPTWSGGRGKGIIGVVNYLASKGLNAISFLTFSHLGTDGNVYPYISPSSPLRYHCAKLDQWDRLFTHMDANGLMMHIKLQEVQSIKYWDDGALGKERKLYYKEMIARFGHHMAIVWNLGEEIVNDKDTFDANNAARFANADPAEDRVALRSGLNIPADGGEPLTAVDHAVRQDSFASKVSAKQLKFFVSHATIRSYANYIRGLDPYNHPIVMHTWPTDPIKVPAYQRVIADGRNTPIEGFSLQGHTYIISYFEDTKRWIDQSSAAGVPKVITSDEQGPYESGIPDDSRDFWHDANRTQVLWPHFMAGGAGHMTYFGFFVPQSDITVTDLRSRDNWFTQVVRLINFFKGNNIPFQNMRSSDTMTTDGSFVLYQANNQYVIYTIGRSNTVIRMGSDTNSYRIRWFDPRAGGSLAAGTVRCVSGGGSSSIGRRRTTATPAGRDWVAYLTRDDSC